MEQEISTTPNNDVTVSTENKADLSPEILYRKQLSDSLLYYGPKCFSWIKNCIDHLNQHYPDQIATMKGNAQFALFIGTNIFVIKTWFDFSKIRRSLGK